MKAIKIGISGSSGRMGTTIAALLSEDKKYLYKYAVDLLTTKESPIFQTAKFQSDKAKNLDVWIDFSSPKLLLKIAKPIADLKIPLVSGTTGLSSLEKKKLFSLGTRIPILWAPNMSLGMAIFRNTVRAMTLAEQGPYKNSCEFLIEEIHHKFKKDSPSGTALALQEILREGDVRENLQPIVSIRGGSLSGTHRVYGFLEDEVILLEHVALSRRIFAKGALFAAQWLVKQPPGVYTMDDILTSRRK